MFPQPDTEIRDFFRDSSPTEDEMVFRCYAFFKSLFSEVREHVKSLLSLKPTNYSTFAVQWKDYLEQDGGEVRSQMYSSIVEVCGKI